MSTSGFQIRDYLLDANQGKPGLDTAIAFIVIGIVFVGLKLLARAVTRTRPGWDDYLLLPTLLVFVGECASMIYEVKYAGSGRHALALLGTSPETLVLFIKMQLVYITFYIPANLLPKLIIISYYMRIFNSKKLRITCWVLVGIILVYLVLAMLITWLSCIPIQYLWDSSIRSARCIDIYAWWTYGTVPNIFIDFFMILLPVPVIWKLQLSWKDRAGLLAAFGSALVGTAAGIARIIIFAQTNRNADPSWYSTILGIMGIVESGTSLMAACIPGIRPLYLWLRRRSRNSAQRLSDRTDTANLPLKNQAYGYGVSSRRLGVTNTPMYQANVGGGEKNLTNRSDETGICVSQEYGFGINQ